jgi:hypothetical protein
MVKPIQKTSARTPLTREAIVTTARECGIRGKPSVGVRKSKTVALRHPVMPVGYGFRSRVVGINSRQL